MSRSVERAPIPGFERLWDASDVAHYLKVSRSWVYHQAEAGALPHRRVGALLRFDPATIRAFALGNPIPARETVASKPRDKRPSS
jgi:excisionase family DNA binding protein